MKFIKLEAEGVMGCNYELNFNPNYTVIIGKNRQGKTLAARLIMLALYGLQTPKELHNSWKLRNDELLPTTTNGYVDLQLENQGKKYRIRREFNGRNAVELSRWENADWKVITEKDGDVKDNLEDEIRITPGLMNVIMSNEEGLIGSLFYDDELQADVWEGWRWKTEIIRDNLKKARNKCRKEAKNHKLEIEGLEEKINVTEERFIDQELFSKDKIEQGLDRDLVNNRLEELSSKINELAKKRQEYLNFHQTLIEHDNLEKFEVVKNLKNACNNKLGTLDEKELIRNFKSTCESYSSTLQKIDEKGGSDQIKTRIDKLIDELSKLRDAKETSAGERTLKPISEECLIYPPEEDKKLTVEIPSEAVEQFTYADMSSGNLAVPYDVEREAEVDQEKEELKNLIIQFEEEKEGLKQEKDKLREKMGKRRDAIEEDRQRFENRKIILEENIKDYLIYKEDVSEKERKRKKLEIAKRWFNELREALEAEESLKKIRRETVNFINQIYRKSYGWDIVAELEDEDKIIVTDEKGNLRSHPSGSEIHIMGMAWRWMVARGFDLPLVLDELDALLDSENFEKTRKIIEEKMDRQVIILTLQENLKELPGNIYQIIRTGGITTLTEVSRKGRLYDIPVYL